MTQVALTQAVFVHPKALVESDQVGAGTRVWAFAHILPGARVGRGCNICDHAFIESGAVLGDNVTVKNGVAIWDGITIEDDVFLGPNCVLTNDFNPRAYIKKPAASLDRTLIRSHATIGANATVVCGVTIGKYAFVGAGAVIIRSIPYFALVVGNPSRQIGWMCACAKRLSLPANAPLGASVVCSTCQAAFTATVDGLQIVDRNGKGNPR